MSATCSVVDGNVFQIRPLVLDSYCESVVCLLFLLPF